MSDYPKGFPHFETEEELRALIQEALDDPRPGIVMGSQEWEELFAELMQPGKAEKIAS